MARGFFRRTFIPLNAPHLEQESDDPARQSLGVGDAVAAQALAQVACLAHIQNSFRCAAHQVNARPGREAREKLIAEPLHKRLRRIEEPELAGSHASISAQPPSGATIITGKAGYDPKP
jgi:hypothetical protein